MIIFAFLRCLIEIKCYICEKFNDMDLQQVIEAISAVGFPIVLAIFMVVLLIKQSGNHKDEVKALTDTINSNTQILRELKTVIETLIKK